jgi:hypothetical protein
MDDLVEFLRARLDEDEAAARVSADFGGGIYGYHWHVSGSHADEGGTYWRIVAIAKAGEAEQVVEVVGSGMSGGGAHTEQVAHHAVRHDPARVLREVEAKRQLLAVHHPYVEEPDQACLGCYGGIEWETCPVLRALAAVYADHPDYWPE